MGLLIYGEILPKFFNWYVIVFLYRYMVFLRYEIFASNWVWIYDRWHPSRGEIKPEFYEGVKEFITACIRIEQCIREETVKCPCRKCKCRRFVHIYFGVIVLILCIYSYMHVMYAVYVYWFIHMLHRSLMVGRGS